jgi:hypothetical protein
VRTPFALLLLASGCAVADPAPTGPRLYFFVGTECPVSNFYAPEIGRLAARIPDSTLVYCERGVTDRSAAAHAAAYRLGLPLRVDSSGALARTFGVERIPTAVLVGADGAVAYRGRIDDRYSPEGKRRDEPRARDLEAAIDAVAAGRPPAVREAPVFGCPLSRETHP